MAPSCLLLRRGPVCNRILRASGEASVRRILRSIFDGSTASANCAAIHLHAWDLALRQRDARSSCAPAARPSSSSPRRDWNSRSAPACDRAARRADSTVRPARCAKSTSPFTARTALATISSGDFILERKFAGSQNSGDVDHGAHHFAQIAIGLPERLRHLRAPAPRADCRPRSEWPGSSR